MRSEDEIREALEWEKKELGVWQAERQKMWEERNYRPNVHEGYMPKLTTFGLLRA